MEHDVGIGTKEPYLRARSSNVCDGGNGNGKGIGTASPPGSE